MFPESYETTQINTYDKVFKNGPSEICERQPLKNFTWSILEYFIPHREHFPAGIYLLKVNNRNT